MSTIIPQRTHIVSVRPTTVTATVGLLLFLGITAVGGGAAFLLDIGMGDGAWLEEIPIVTNMVVPGLVLGLGFGFGSLLTAHGLLRRHHWPWLRWVETVTGHMWPWAGTLALGVGMMTWIGLQLVWLDLNFLQVLYGSLGVALVSLSMTTSFRRFLRVTT